MENKEIYIDELIKDLRAVADYEYQFDDILLQAAIVIEKYRLALAFALNNAPVDKVFEIQNKLLAGIK